MKPGGRETLAQQARAVVVSEIIAIADGLRKELWKRLDSMTRTRMKRKPPSPALENPKRRYFQQ
jgi:hypothetical protein